MKKPETVDTPLTSDVTEPTHELIEIPPAFDDEPDTTAEASRVSSTKSNQITKTTTASGSRLQQLQTTSPTALLAAVVGLVILIGLLGFGAGAHYQKERGTSAVSATNAASNMMGQNSMINGGAAGGATGGQSRYGAGRRGSLNGSFGTVTAISSSSISVQDRRAGTVKTYSVTADTSISDGGTTASTSDIAIGDNVIISASSSTSTVATRIIVNGGMGGPGGAPSGQTQTAPSSSDTTTAVPSNT